tara:strand:- start:3377 stop:4303 length:927 start_codon:yes stop_codon:yes gene_type:complete
MAFKNYNYFTQEIMDPNTGLSTGETRGYKTGRALGAALGRLFGGKTSGKVTDKQNKDVSINQSYDDPANDTMLPHILDTSELREDSPLNTEMGPVNLEAQPSTIDNITEALSKVPGALSEIPGKVGEGLSKVPDKLVEAGGEIADIPENIAELLYTSRNEGGTLDNIGGKLKDRFQDAGQALYDMPSNIKETAFGPSEIVPEGGEQPLYNKALEQIGDIPFNIAETISNSETLDNFPQKLGNRFGKAGSAIRDIPYKIGSTLYQALFGNEEEIEVYEPPEQENQQPMEGEPGYPPDELMNQDESQAYG